MKSPSIRFASAFLVLLALVTVAPVRGDANLAFTAFPNADLNSLANGQVLQARGGLIDFQRGVTAQSLYFVAAPPAAVDEKLTSWNPASHHELQVWLHRPLPPHPTANDFSGLNDLPDNSSVNNMIKATYDYSAGSDAIQLNKGEAQLVTALHGQAQSKAQIVNLWSQIIAGRVNDYLGGSLANTNYTASSGHILPLAEARSLLRSDPKIYREFQPMLAGTPAFNQHHTTPSQLYYECFDIENTAAFGTGAVYHAVSPATILHADVEYYVSSGIYTSVELEQLWPVTLNGKAGTLVWRADMVSTFNVAYLHGTERLASGMLMLQDVKQAVDAFRSEFK
jgi:hypothetical protein